MIKKSLLTLLCLLSIPVILMAQTGKIAGKVTDSETREPLIGASVRVIGTTLGATTDINGNFVILNVPVGTHSLECSYIGYQKVTVHNNRVVTNQTTERSFPLPSDAVKAPEVIIVAQKPLVNKNETNVQATKSQSELENLPVRGVENIAALAANVVQQGGAIYVRGSRSDQVKYYNDGVPITNPVGGGRAGSIINNAIEEINLQAGGYSAEYGGANGGIISTTTRSGGQKLQFAAEVITDSWNKPGKEALGGYNYGLSQYILTAGGPIVGPLKFFVAGQNSFQRTPIRYFDGYDMTKYYAANNPAILSSDAWDRLPASEKYYVDPNGSSFKNKAGETVVDANDKPILVKVGADGKPIPRPGIFDPQLGSSARLIPVEYGAGLIVNNASQNNIVQGNLTADLNRLNLRFSGSYGYASSRGGAGVTTTNSEMRAALSESENLTTNFKLTHMLSDKTFYELNVNYFYQFGVSMDPDLEHDMAHYGDSITNAKYGYTLYADGVNPRTKNVFGSTFAQPGHALAGYSKSGFRSIGGKFNIVHQMGANEIKFGGEATSYNIRQYNQGAFEIKSFMRENPQATTQLLSKGIGTDNYGYDFWGNAVDSGPDGPKEPMFLGVYLMDKIELEDLVLNLGLRYDYIDTKSKTLRNPSSITYDANGLIEESNFVDADPAENISPRLGFSFPVTDATVFYAQYGKFVSQSRLRDVYQGLAAMSYLIGGGYAVSSPVGFGLRPERTTQYDIGFRQQIGENFAFDISAFYKDTRGEVQIRQIVADPSAQHQTYYAWMNGDFATTVGTALRLNLRRVERVQASVDYTYSDARGTGSTSSTSFRTIWQAPTGVPYFPQFATSRDFDQTHRGSVNFDYRFNSNDGPMMGSIYPLERVGLNFLFTFNSGHPYTRVNDQSYGNARIPTEELNASRTPWNFQIDARLDKSFSVGPLDMNLYIWVINLLDTKNVEDVFIQSGSAYDNGYLGTQEGRKRVDSYAAYGEVFGQEYLEFYEQMNFRNVNFFGPPRQIRVGFRCNF